MESIRLSTTLPATPDQVYEAWLSSEGHTKMTGSVATVDSQKSGRFTAWDGYITGTNLLLEPPRRIVQAWRTQEFPGSNPDSKLEIRLVRAPRVCRLMLLQSGISDGQGEMYTEGWEQHYFEPMNAYFSTLPRTKASRESQRSKSKKKKQGKSKTTPKRGAPARATAKRAPKRGAKALRSKKGVTANAKKGATAKVKKDASKRR